jgi:hypothetical protein
MPGMCFCRTRSPEANSCILDDPWSTPAPTASAPSVPRPKQAAPMGGPKPALAKQVPTAVITPVSSTPATSQEWAAPKESDWQDGGSSVAVDDKPSPANISLAGLSKEEKEKEMARRREERKAVSRESVHGLTPSDRVFFILGSSANRGHEEEQGVNMKSHCRQHQMVFHLLTFAEKMPMAVLQKNVQMTRVR